MLSSASAPKRALHPRQNEPSSHEGGFIFTVHFCNNTVSKCVNFAALICFYWIATIVGYNTITIDKEYTLLTVNFDDVNGTALDIQKAFPYTTGMTKGLTYAEGDNIQIMQSDGGYETYFLSNGRSGKGGSSYDEGLDGKWSLMGKNAVAERNLASGTTFWYLARGGKTSPFTMTVSGAVSNSESETYTINKSYTLIGCPYPCDISINGGIEVTGGTKGLTYAEADNIQIMNDEGGYDTYFLSNGRSGKGGSSYDEGLDGKWSLMGKNAVTTDKFPAGKGAFYLSRSKSGTVKFNNPIK